MQRKISNYFENHEKLRFCVHDSNHVHIMTLIKLGRGKPKFSKHSELNQILHLIWIKKPCDSSQTLHLIRIKIIRVTSAWFDSNKSLHVIRIRKFCFHISLLALFELIQIRIYTWFESRGFWFKSDIVFHPNQLRNGSKTVSLLVPLHLLIWLKSWNALWI